MPFIDQIVTDYTIDANKQKRRLTVTLQYKGEKSFGLVSLRDAIANIYSEIADGYKEKTEKMLNALIN